MKTFEESGMYQIDVDEKKNHFDLTFMGHMKKADDIPNYIEHVQSAVNLLKEGFTLLAEIKKESKPPGFQITGLLKQSQDIIKGGGNKKTAVFVPKNLILQRMTLNVVTKLSGLDIQVFTDRDEAEKWLSE